MNRHVLRALAADAFYQVLDNWVFRILAVLTALPILLTFVVGLREEGIVLLFGLKTWSYGDFFGAFGGSGSLPASDLRAALIEGVLQTVLDFLAGSMGMLLCLAATGFFVPRLLEKGAADLYFHKPVSRWTLYLSRYFAGLLFVALVGSLLVVGLYLGLLLVSRHNDPGILVAAVSLTYVFALVFSFSMLVGVVTRSTVASILLSSFFFLFNGSVHLGWTLMQQSSAGPGLMVHLEEEEPDPPEAARRPGDAQPRGPVTETDEKESPAAFTRILRTLLCVLHYTLPKTNDADVFAHKVRQALDAPEFQDEGSLVTVFRLPEGFRRARDDALPALAPAYLAQLLGEPRFATQGEERMATTFSLWRRAPERSESHNAGRVRVRTETTSQAGQKLEQLLAQQASLREVERQSTHFGSGPGHRNILASLVTWREGEAERAHSWAALAFKGASEDVYTLLVDVAGELPAEELARQRERLTERMGLDARAVEEWYPRQVGFFAPLPYNVFFSIGSSLAFALALLLVGRWRLARIAF